MLSLGSGCHLQDLGRNKPKLASLILAGLPARRPPLEGRTREADGTRSGAERPPWGSPGPRPPRVPVGLTADFHQTSGLFPSSERRTEQRTSTK